MQDREGQHGDADDDDHELDELAQRVALMTAASADRRGASGAEAGPDGARPYFFRGVTRNMRSTSSAGAWYSTRFEMPHTPRSPHL